MEAINEGIETASVQQIYAADNLDTTSLTILRMEVCKHLPNIESTRECLTQVQKIEHQQNILMWEGLGVVVCAMLIISLIIWRACK